MKISNKNRTKEQRQKLLIDAKILDESGNFVPEFFSNETLDRDRNYRNSLKAESDILVKLAKEESDIWNKHMTFPKCSYFLAILCKIDVYVFIFCVFILLLFI